MDQITLIRRFGVTHEVTPWRVDSAAGRGDVQLGRWRSFIRTILVLTATALAAGCTADLGTLRAEKPAYVTTVAGVPDRVASCLRDRILVEHNNVDTSITTGPDGTLHLVLHANAGPMIARVFYWDIALRPKDNNTTHLEARSGTLAFGPYPPDNVIAGYTQDCNDAK